MRFEGNIIFTYQQVLKRLNKYRNKAKRLKMACKPSDESMKLTPDLKVGDFLSGDYTREIELKAGLFRDICGLWKSKDMCDVTIECFDGSIQAHKLFLSGTWIGYL